jgi:hypothetical protein
LPGVLIHGRGRLSTTLAFSVVEINCGNGMFAENAFESGAAVHRPGGVISHHLIVVFLPVTTLEQEVLTLRLQTMRGRFVARDQLLAMSQEFCCPPDDMLHPTGTLRFGMGGAANSRWHGLASQRAQREDREMRALSVAIPVSAYISR